MLLVKMRLTGYTENSTDLISVKVGATTTVFGVDDIKEAEQFALLFNLLVNPKLSKRRLIKLQNDIDVDRRGK